MTKGLEIIKAAISEGSPKLDKCGKVFSKLGDLITILLEKILKIVLLN